MEGLIIINEFLKIKKFDDIYGLLKESFEKHNIEIKIKSNADILVSINETIDLKADFILFWDKDIMLAKHLENLGYRVFNNSKAIEICDDKGLTAITLEKHGIKMPKTILSPFTFANIRYSNYKFIDTIIEKLGFPMIIKENKGSFGKQVYLATEKCEIIRILNQIQGKNILFQEFIKSSYGKDIRVQVTGNKVSACVMRTAMNGDFIANVTNGGKMTPFEPTKEITDLALKACKILNLDFAGVDILFGEDGPILCEVNSNAHFKNILDATGKNIADDLVEYIISKL